MNIGSETVDIVHSPRVADELPRAIGVLGGLFLLITVVEGIMVTRGLATPEGYQAGIVTSLLFVAAIFYGAFWIKHGEIDPSRYGRVGLWCLASLLLFSLFIAIVSFASGPLTILGIVSTVRWAASVGAGLGLLIGVFDARAMQQAFEAGMAWRRQEETLRERDRLEEFASVIAHDLRNPLSVAEGRVALAAEECNSEHLDQAAQAHDRMDSLLDDMLDLAKAGETIGEMSPVDLNEVAEAAWSNVDTASATLEVRAGRAISADHSRLQQLLENLFRNAVEHGGSEVTVRIGDLAGGFFVEDDGPGIPNASRTEILEPGHTTSESGTGFGLAIVRDIAQAHDWEIAIAAGAEGGARFEFTGVAVE